MHAWQRRVRGVPERDRLGLGMCRGRADKARRALASGQRRYLRSMRSALGTVTPPTVPGACSKLSLIAALIFGACLAACGGLVGTSGADAGPAAREVGASDGPATRDTGPRESGARDGKPTTGPCGASGEGLVTLASGIDVYGFVIALDATDVYFVACPAGKTCVDAAGMALMKVPLCGGKPTVLGAGPGRGVSGLAIDAANAYWASSGTVMKVPLSGGTVTTLATPIPGLEFGNASGAVEVDSSSVYWSVPGDGTVMKVAIDGGAPTTLASGFYFPEGSPYGGFSIVLEGMSVYWLNAGQLSDGGAVGAIVEVPLDGGTPTTLISGQGISGEVAADRMSVYFASTLCPSDGGDCECDGGACPAAFLKVPLSGGAPTTLASVGPTLFKFAIDDTSLYWTECPSCTSSFPASDGKVMKVPLTGGTPTTVASGRRVPGAIAVDATSVYWTDNGSVMKLTPK
jgi:hypothetical protein